LELLNIEENIWEVVTTCTTRECLEHTMNTMRMVTKNYTMNKVVGNNERTISKRDSEWMGVEEREWVLAWWVLEWRSIGEGFKK